jgi:putative spermidine/putrescine transport system permease protein
MSQQGGFAQASWTQRNPNAIWLLLVAPALVYLSIFFVYPVVRIVLRSLFAPEFTLVHYARLIDNPAYLRILWQTVRISLLVSFISLVLGYPAAVFVSRARGRTAGILLALVLLPFWTSVLVRTYAWIVVLGSDGVINSVLLAAGIISQPLALVYNELAVVIGMVHVLLPYMILTLVGVMRGIDPVYLRAAANLGAGARASFLRVYLPLSMPGVTAGFLLVFILSMGFFITPALLGGGNVEMIALQIDAQISDLVDWGFGSALATTLFIIVIGLVLLFTAAFDVDAFGYAQKPYSPQRRGESKVSRRNKKIFSVFSAKLNVLSDSAVNRGRDTLKVFDQVRVSRLFRKVRPRSFDVPVRSYGRIALSVWTVSVLVFLVAPVLIIVPMSFGETAYLSFPPRGFTLDGSHSIVVPGRDCDRCSVCRTGDARGDRPGTRRVPGKECRVLYCAGAAHRASDRVGGRSLLRARAHAAGRKLLGFRHRTCSARDASRPAGGVRGSAARGPVARACRDNSRRHAGPGFPRGDATRPPASTDLGAAVRVHYIVR